MRNDTEWEARCRRCGRCCYEKIDCNGRIHYTDEPCEMLDPETRLCTVYHDRYERRPGCTPLTPEVLERGIMPGDCPYVAAIDSYPAPRMCDGRDNDESDD